MNPREQGFLLLTSQLGNPERKPLTPARLRTLAARAKNLQKPVLDRELTAGDLVTLGYDPDSAEKILSLLSEEELLQHYLFRGRRMDCVPVTRVSEGYPMAVRSRLGLDSPGCLWAKGDTALLAGPKIALVGSRELHPENEAFAYEVGKQAALQGVTLVSGNARGADRTAQNACLEWGGKVVSVVADELERCPLQRNVLYLSQDSFDAAFSVPRALSRNRIIHTLAEAVLVAQCTPYRGGTWDGTVKNLKNNWTPVFCLRDGSRATVELNQLGAQYAAMKDLTDLKKLMRSEKQIKMEGLV